MIACQARNRSQCSLHISLFGFIDLLGCQSLEGRTGNPPAQHMGNNADITQHANSLKASNANMMALSENPRLWSRLRQFGRQWVYQKSLNNDEAYTDDCQRKAGLACSPVVLHIGEKYPDRFQPALIVFAMNRAMARGRTILFASKPGKGRNKVGGKQRLFPAGFPAGGFPLEKNSRTATLEKDRPAAQYIGRRMSISPNTPPISGPRMKPRPKAAPTRPKAAARSFLANCQPYRHWQRKKLRRICRRGPDR